jgi:LmbE family N-acetylglucosaminyl deacetylase
MSSDRKMRILCVIAHPDDLEMMAGGTIAKWIGEGHFVRVLTLTDGAWTMPSGEEARDTREMEIEEARAAEYLGLTVENLRCRGMELRFDDGLVREVLRRIEKLRIDTILCPWERDIHHDHEVASRIAISATRRTPRVLMGQINFFLRDFFRPNVFVDISETWERKIKALECYRTQWERNGKEWYQFLDETTRHYGRIVGVERAEGFVCNKFLLD